VTQRILLSVFADTRHAQNHMVLGTSPSRGV
jgi:hypothetical protein